MGGLTVSCCRTYSTADAVVWQIEIDSAVGRNDQPNDDGPIETIRQGFIMQAALAAKDDDSLKALGFILEAWEEGTESGVAPELMAYAALYTALTDLVAAFGEESVADLALGLAKRVNKGEFTLYSSKQ